MQNQNYQQIKERNRDLLAEIIELNNVNSINRNKRVMNLEELRSLSQGSMVTVVNDEFTRFQHKKTFAGSGIIPGQSYKIETINGCMIKVYGIQDYFGYLWFEKP